MGNDGTPGGSERGETAARSEEVVAGVLTRLRLPYLLDGCRRACDRCVRDHQRLPQHRNYVVRGARDESAVCVSFAWPNGVPVLLLTASVPAASPRNTLYGHFIGAAVGWGCLLAFGLQGEGPSTAVGVTWERVLAAGLSLGLTSGLMVLVRAPHPPAGATTLIISLGVLHEFEHLVVLMFAVVLLTLQAIGINRLAGIPYPLWRSRAP